MQIGSKFGCLYYDDVTIVWIDYWNVEWGKTAELNPFLNKMTYSNIGLLLSCFGEKIVRAS